MLVGLGVDDTRPDLFLQAKEDLFMVSPLVFLGQYVKPCIVRARET